VARGPGFQILLSSIQRIMAKGASLHLHHRAKVYDRAVLSQPPAFRPVSIGERRKEFASYGPGGIIYKAESSDYGLVLPSLPHSV
jgi:hypothetical protein